MVGEITIFLLGSGVALFIALLGWSDQIRTPQKETKQLERQFMKKRKITWENLRAMIRSSTPAQKIKSYMNLMRAGKMKHKDINQQIKLLEDLNESKEALEKINIDKYNYTVYLTISCFLFGILSYLFHFKLWKLSEYLSILDSDSVFVLIPIILIIIVCFKILNANKEDQKFRNLIKQIDDEI